MISDRILGNWVIWIMIKERDSSPEGDGNPGLGGGLLLFEVFVKLLNSV